mmetsp:Transcript_3232/g.5655  ORF Transcript_3232/g.5655 Transcript_3232/m.5655 type:complete len:111 (+) Transcript_3232:2-334(+)
MLGHSCCDSMNKSTIFDVSRVRVFSSRVFHPFPNHLRKELSSLGDTSAVENDHKPSNPSRSVTCSAAPNDRGRYPSKVGSSLSLLMLEAFVVSRETKAIHLWGCSWQGGS